MPRKKVYRSGWIRSRFGHLHPPITTTDLVHVLKMHNSTVNHWLAHPTFKAAKIAVKDANGQWEFYRDRLWYWVVAIGAYKVKPEDGSAEEAAKKLGITYAAAKRFRLGQPVLPVDE